MFVSKWMSCSTPQGSLAPSKWEHLDDRSTVVPPKSKRIHWANADIWPALWSSDAESLQRSTKRNPSTLHPSVWRRAYISNHIFFASTGCFELRKVLRKVFPWPAGAYVQDKRQLSFEVYKLYDEHLMQDTHHEAFWACFKRVDGLILTDIVTNCFWNDIAVVQETLRFCRTRLDNLRKSPTCKINAISFLTYQSVLHESQNTEPER
jgi:hypothetical protein